MRNLLLLLFLILKLSLDSQILVQGTVYNNATQKPIIGCSIYNLNTQLGTISNEEGKFQISAQKGDQIQFSYLGMAVVTKYIIDDRDLNIQLNYQVKKIRNVVITDGNLAKYSDLYNPNYEKNKNNRPPEPIARTAEEMKKLAFSGTSGSFSPFSFIYYSLPKVRRRMKAVIDIQNLDASNMKYNLDFIAAVTGEKDENTLRDIKAYCFFPPDEILQDSYYELGIKLQNCYIDYLVDPNKPKPIDSSYYIQLEKFKK